MPNPISKTFMLNAYYAKPGQGKLKMQLAQPTKPAVCPELTPAIEKCNETSMQLMSDFYGHTINGPKEPQILNPSSIENPKPRSP